MKSKKEIINNSILILLSYVLLFIFNNFKTIIKIILGRTLDNSLEFINISILLSLIIMILIVVFKKLLFKNKLHLWIIFCTLLVYNFAEGYYSGFVVYSFIVLYIYILLLTYVVMLLTKKGFEVSIVTGFSGLLIITFIIGMFGFLKIIKYLMLVSFILMIYYMYRIYKKDKKRLFETKDNFFSGGFVIFNLLWMIAVLGGAGMYVNSWDEYSHWAYDAKATIYYSKFGASQEIMSKTKGYAPIFTIWHYIVSIFNGFSEHNLYVGISMLISIYLMPAFYWLNKHNFITKFLSFISLTFCCYIFSGVYIYSSLYADLAIAVIFSAILILYNISEDTKENLTLPIVLLLIIITLSKTNGFVIAFTFMLIVFFNYIFNKIKGKITLKIILDSIIKFIRKYYKFIIAIIITFIIWKLYLFIMSKVTTEYYDFNLLPDSLRGDLEVKLDSEFIKDFMKKVILSFDSNLITGKINLSLYQFLIISFSILFFVFYLKNNKKIDIAVKKTIPYVVGYIAFFILTVLAMFLMMSKYEASNLASFGRYLNWYHLGMLIFILSYPLNIEIKNKSMSVNLFYVIIILLIPFSNIIYFIYNPLNSGSYNVYLKYNDKAKILNKYTPQESMVYIIDQKDNEGIMAMWHMRYYAFPRQTNASSGAINWKIRTEKNLDDLADWGLTAEKWADQLIKYKFDYVYLFSSDEYFFKETEFLYDDVNTAKKYSLFKVALEGNNIKLVPVK